MEAGTVRNLFGEDFSIEIKYTHIIIFTLSLLSIIIGFSPSFYDVLDIYWMVAFMIIFCAIGTILWIREYLIDTKQKIKNIFTIVCEAITGIAFVILMIYLILMFTFSQMNF